MAAVGGSDRGRGDAAKPNGRCAALVTFSGQHWHRSMLMQAVLMLATAECDAVLSMRAAQTRRQASPPWQHRRPFDRPKCVT